jgi:hypothetical protein
MPIASPSSIAGALIDPPIKQILLDQRSVSNALTAFAGGGQTGSLLLTSSINRVTTVGTAADSVLLPPARAGVRVVVINAAAANSMNVFPSGRRDQRFVSQRSVCDGGEQGGRVRVRSRWHVEFDSHGLTAQPS